MSYSKYIPVNERPVISALITAALVDGNTISVNDSEDWVVRCSNKPGTIRAALGSSGEDSITIHNSAGEQIGWFWLIYNNGSEGEPMIVIADYAGNEYCDQIWNELSARYST